MMDIFGSGLRVDCVETALQPSLTLWSKGTLFMRGKRLEVRG
jgi:hypothetical protein